MRRCAHADSSANVNNPKSGGLLPRNPCPALGLGRRLDPCRRAVGYLEAGYQPRIQMRIVPAVDVLEARHGRGIRIGFPVLGEKQLFSRTVGQRGVQQFNEVPYRARGQSVVQNRGYRIIGDARGSFPSYEPSASCFRVSLFGNHGTDSFVTRAWPCRAALTVRQHDVKFNGELLERSRGIAMPACCRHKNRRKCDIRPS